jgi:hypothetical protein
VPEIARFFGLIIRMFAEPGAPHNQPHFHIYYQNYSAVYSIDPIDLMNGDLPLRQKRLVEAWAECIRASWQRIGSVCKPANCPTK